jgi:hypothetical protein
MESLVERLEDEAGVKVAKLEVWHNEANAKLMREYDKYCGGFFSIIKDGKWICGNADYER